MPHEIYNCDKVIEVFMPNFCHQVKWTETNNYTPTAPGEKAFVIDDDTEVGLGWRVRDGAPIAPEVEVLEDIKADKINAIARDRWEAETNGITFQGMTIDTSRESQALITGAALQATLDPTYTCRWKTAQGFVELTTEMVLAVALAVRQHVQACFDREAYLSVAIAAEVTIEDVQAISWDDED
jgi:hypothetical protein